MRVLILFFVVTLTVVSATNDGPITIMVDGQAQTKYVLSGAWSKTNVNINGSKITLTGGGRIYLGDSSDDNISVNSFYNMPLLGKRLKFDVDLSDVGCNCNGALYFITMPGYNSGQQPVPGPNGEYYCDAQGQIGPYCPEMDVMEANKFAMASTAHTCQYQPPHYYSTCDHGGCGTNVLDSHQNDFGPGKKIDTNKPFTLSVTFITGGNGRLSTINNYFYQEGRVIQFNACNADYLQWMGMSLPGIVMSISLWGTGDGGMAWLDGKSGCKGACNVAGSKFAISNIQLVSI